MSYLVSRFKSLRIYWYEMMKPLHTNLNLVNKKMFGMHDPFNVVDCSYNYVMLVGISNHLLYCHCEIITSGKIRFILSEHNNK